MTPAAGAPRTRTVAEKMRVRPDSRALLVGAPAEVIEGLGLPAVRWVGPVGPADHIHLFVTRSDDLVDTFPGLRDRVAPGGRLWVSWPKAGRLGSDLTIREVIRIGYDLGMVESTCLRVDDTWAALCFTRPKPGRRYANSYGRLPDTAGSG